MSGIIGHRSHSTPLALAAAFMQQPAKAIEGGESADAAMLEYAPALGSTAGMGDVIWRCMTLGRCGSITGHGQRGRRIVLFDAV